MTELLKNLCNLDGISGDEGTIRDFIISEIKDYCEYKIDNLGNIIAFKKGKKTPEKKIMLDAHMDEVGLIITSITDSGFLKFKALGLETESLLQRKVKINGNITGVISGKPVHLLSGDEAKKLPKTESLYVDIGAVSKEEAEKYVSLGDSAVICGDYLAQGNKIISKALDDRVGCAILINLIKNFDEYDFHASFSVQEEVGIRGAKVASYAINPDCAIVLEGTTASDIAGVPEDKTVCHLGWGPAVSFMDRATSYDRAFYKAAMSSGIKCQTKASVTGGNDAASIHLSREGVRTLGISVPCRYIHSESSVADISDMENAYKLAEYMLLMIASGEIE